MSVLDFVISAVVIAVLGLFCSLIGVITWSMFEETEIGSHIVDKLIKRDEE